MSTNKPLYVLAKTRKLPTWKQYGEYEVAFYFSDEEKNFRRAKDCTPEVQKLAAFYSPASIFNPTEGITFNYFDYTTKEIVPVPIMQLDFEVAHGMILDCFGSDCFDLRITEQMIREFAYRIYNYGLDLDQGKVFLKCGNKAKIEIEVDDEIHDKIHKLFEEYLK